MQGISRLSLNCAEMSWTIISLDTFDELGNDLEHKVFDAVKYFKIPNPKVGYFNELCKDLSLTKLKSMPNKANEHGPK